MRRFRYLYILFVMRVLICVKRWSLAASVPRQTQLPWERSGSETCGVRRFYPAQNILVGGRVGILYLVELKTVL